MGLDMYVFQVDKLSKNEKALYKDMLQSEIQCSIILENDFKANYDLFKEMESLMTRVRIKGEFFDMERLLKENNADKDDDVIGFMYGSDVVSYSLRSGKRINLSIEEYNNYIYTKPTYAYLFNKEEIAYWRKAYDLEEKIYKRHRQKMVRNYVKKCKCGANECPSISPEMLMSFEIQNCGFYKLSNAERKAIAKSMEEDEPGRNILLDTNVKNLFYHEWY